MSDKHYTPNYLENTGIFLRDIKRRSYQPFQNIRQGIVADIGCGTGLDVLGLSEYLGNELKVVGIDHDPVMLEKAKLSAGDNPNVSFILSEANLIPFENEALQGIRAERLIQHLPNAQAAVGEMHRALAKGKPLVIVETDWPNLTFYHGQVQTEKKIIRYLSEEKINNGAAAREMTGYLNKVGFIQVHIEVIPIVVRTLREANEYLWIDRILAETEEKGIAGSEEIRSFSTAMRTADDKGFFACSINMVIVTGIK